MTADVRTTRIGPTVVALLVGALITQFEITIVGTAMPAISADLHDHSLYPWVFSGYLVAYTAAVPAFGMINDSLGRRQAYLTAMLLLCAGSIVCASATSMEMLIAGRLIQGCGAGAVYVSAQTIMGDLFSIQERARVQGYLSLTLSVGTATGPALGGFFVTHGSWRWSFLITLPIALVATTLLLYGYRPTSPNKRGAKPNWIGAILLTLALAALLFAFGKHDVDVRLLALAAAITVPFLWHERRASRPILPPDLFRMPAFILASLTVMFMSSVQIASMVFMPLYLQGALGLTPTLSGYLQTVPITILAAASTFTVGPIVKRYGFRTAVRAGALFLVVSTVSTALAAWIDLGTPGSTGALALMLLGQAALGASMGLTITASMICVQNQVTQERRGTATASLQLMRGIAMLATPVALGAIYLAGVRARNLGIDPDQFLNPKALASVAPASLATARAGLGEALRALIWPVVGASALAVVASLFFPRAVETEKVPPSTTARTSRAH